MDSKPLITFAGDESLFSSLQFGVCQGLPVECVEWRRSFGRAPKKVYVECNFAKFTEELLPKDGDWKLIDQPFFHTYWTDCVDVDSYKATVRDDISNWLTILRNNNVHDWLVITVETMDNRKVNKTKLLPRASVMDKIKSDFCGRSPDRCVSLLDPLKSDSRGAESWQGLLQRVRQLLLQAYNRYLSKFEEHMRSQREKRNEPGWSFCEYFLLQEELAFIFEMLGIYDEALVQYDELDALFTQFVLNSNVGDTPDWLNKFSRCCDSWRGLALLHTVDQQSRQLIGAGKASLIEFRNYLFSRQCSLLLLLYRPWEMAQRTLPILHNCINELQILEVTMPPGAVGCWVFLCSLEVLHTCERFNDSGQVEAYSLYTAGLWAYARDKLHDLGVLCGLMPGMTASSEQLHTVVLLSAGMNENADDHSPVAKLKEALSSKDAFQRHYLELSELAMGTFKHIGRIRSARLIGKDLASFYMKLGQPQKAAAFLSDMLKTSVQEGWDTLVADTQLDLVQCYKATGDYDKCMKICAQIAATDCLGDDVRRSHFDQMISLGDRVGKDSPLLLVADDIFKIGTMNLDADSDIIISESNLKMTVVIESQLTRDLRCDKMSLSLCRIDESSALPSVDGEAVPKGRFSTEHNVFLEEHFECKQDNTLTTSSLVCSNLHGALRRRDSQFGLHKGKEPTKREFARCIFVDGSVLKPGSNVVEFSCKAGEPGNYVLSQLSVQMNRSEFVISNWEPSVSFRVVSESPKIFLQRATRGDLVAGAEQELVLTVHSGSTTIEADTVVRLQASKGLLLKVDEDGEKNPPFMQSVDCTLPVAGPFQTVVCKVKVLAEVLSQKESSGSFERKVAISSPWMMEKQSAQLVFVLPFVVQHKLHTTNTRKFIQVLVQGLQPDFFELFEHKLEIVNGQGGLSVVPLSPPDQHLIVCKDQNGSYLWEILNETSESSPLQMQFAMNYRLKSDERTEPQTTYKHQFELNNYKTIYTIRSKVEPIGSEFCRMGSICHMNITINCTIPSAAAPSLMYEVLADQMSWAVCGRTAGVISMASDDQHNVTLDVMPLTRGFLPFPNVRLSKYIPADSKTTMKGLTFSLEFDSPKKADLVPSSAAPQHPRLEPFSQGQVFNGTKAFQIHVLPALGTNSES